MESKKYRERERGEKSSYGDGVPSRITQMYLDRRVSSLSFVLSVNGSTTLHDVTRSPEIENSR